MDGKSPTMSVFLPEDVLPILLFLATPLYNSPLLICNSSFSQQQMAILINFSTVSWNYESNNFLFVHINAMCDLFSLSMIIIPQCLLSFLYGCRRSRDRDFTTLEISRRLSFIRLQMRSPFVSWMILPTRSRSQVGWII